MTPICSKARRTAITSILIAGILLPPFYFFVMVQYGAITLPYWDHLATAKQIIEFFDGSLTWQSLIEPQAQARPLFPRLIFIANAAMTRWDIRSEYAYIYLTVGGAWITLLYGLWRTSGSWGRTPTLAAAVLISIVAFSPVGSTNHTWSLMLLATLSYFCAIAAFVIVSLHPLSRSANIIAAILAWVAAYSISQGLFVFPVILIVQQLIATNKFWPTRWSAFWLVNLVVCYVLYIPGVPLSGGPHPRLFDFFAFIAVYIGNPLGSLLWFPNQGAIDLPYTIIVNGIAGIIILGMVVLSARRAFLELSAKRSETVIFFSLTTYASMSAIVTAWGRANGPYAIASANSSRYSIFAACFLFALIFYYAPKLARGDLRFNSWYKVGTVVFTMASIVTYGRAIKVYQVEHRNNEWLADIYPLHPEPSDLDNRAYPDPVYLRSVRADLFRLSIGPYRSIARPTAPIYAGAFIGAIPLKPGTVITQRFHAAFPVIRSVSFLVVTWGEEPSSYPVHWKVIGIKDGKRSTVGEGELEASDFLDWRMATIRMSSTQEQPEFEVIFSVNPNASVRYPLGLTFNPPGADTFSPALINGKAREDGGKVGLRVTYENPTR